MPPITILPAAREDPYAFANSRAFAGLMDRFGQSRQARHEKSITSAVLNSDGTPKGIMDAIASVQQENTAPEGIMARILNTFNPAGAYTGGPTGTEKSIIGALMQAQNKPQERHTATPWYHSKKWKNTSEGRAALEKATTGMTPDEQINFWSKILDRGLGQYYGTPDAKKPKDPAIVALARKKLKGLGVTGPVSERTKAKPPAETTKQPGQAAEMEPYRTPMMTGKERETALQNLRQDGTVNEIIKRAGEKVSKSPYPEYPDAFLEDGVWKVMVDGEKYRIEG